jgi:hypothetical protein
MEIHQTYQFNKETTQKVNNMSDKNEITRKFKFDQDSKRFHRFQIDTDVGIVGTIYVPKDKESMPEKITLDCANNDS